MEWLYSWFDKFEKGAEGFFEWLARNLHMMMMVVFIGVVVVLGILGIAEFTAYILEVGFYGIMEKALLE